MKPYTILGVNHRLRIPIPEGGAILLCRRDHRRKQVNIRTSEPCHIEITPGLLDKIDTTSSTVFPFTLEVYGLNESMLGFNLMKSVTPEVIDGIGESIRATGKRATTKVIEDALDEMVRKIPTPPSAYLTNKEKRGARRMWVGFMADLICAKAEGKVLEYSVTDWDPERTSGREDAC